MFICRKCRSADKFELMFSPDYKGARNFSVCRINDNDIKISVDGYSFIPSKEFMNEHAVCSYCGSIGFWDYD